MELSKELIAEGAPWVEAAVRLGAQEAKAISPASVVTATWVRLKCQYGCGGYGQKLTCPPHSPTPEQTRRVLDEYVLGILLHATGPWTELGQVVPALEREVFLAGNYKAFGFACGPCNQCRTCNLKACTHPREARPAMEAAGIDVYATARANGYPIQVVTGPECAQNYYGLVLVR